MSTWGLTWTAEKCILGWVVRGRTTAGIERAWFQPNQWGRSGAVFFSGDPSPAQALNIVRDACSVGLGPFAERRLGHRHSDLRGRLCQSIASYLNTVDH